MGFIPANAKWYLAEIVLEITVEDDPRNVVHTNATLVRADSTEEAYEKALVLGKQSETSYENVQGRRVDIVFKGFHDLNVIHGELEHGAEIYFHEQLQVRAEDLRRQIVPREELGVFAPIRPREGPDYGSGEVLREVYKRFPHLRGGRPTRDTPKH